MSDNREQGPRLLPDQHLDMGLYMEPTQEMRELIRRTAELWKTTQKVEHVGYQGLKEEFVQDLRQLIQLKAGIAAPERSERSSFVRGGVLFLNFCGLARSGKTVLSKSTLSHVLGDEDMPIDAPNIYQWHLEWGDVFPLLPSSLIVDESEDDQNNPTVQRRKRLEAACAELMYGEALAMMIEQSRSHTLDIVLCDSIPLTGVRTADFGKGVYGPVGIDRGTQMLGDFARGTGRFSHKKLRKRYDLPKFIGVVPSYEVLEYGGRIRAGMFSVAPEDELAAGIYSEETAAKMIAYLKANNVDVLGDESDPVAAIQRYASGSAKPLQVERLEANMEDYMRWRYHKIYPATSQSEIDAIVFNFRHPQVAPLRQKHILDIFLPDYLFNILQVPDPKNVVMLENKYLLPRTTFNTDYGSNHPFANIPGFVEKLKARTYPKILERLQFYRLLG